MPIALRCIFDERSFWHPEGFEADWRGAHPGVNAVTFMELKEPPATCSKSTT